jgi:ParB family chromosome partitioning protein
MAQSADQRSELLRENEALKQRVARLADSQARVDELEEELRGWDGAKGTRLLDPALIVRSRWANRDPKHYESAEFDALKSELQAAGGNVQPIKVRPLPAGPDGVQRYEVVFGHRRHEACRQLGLPVLALVDNVSDQSLFVEMDRENRLRNNLSPWEQGMMYRRALDEGLFPSNRRLADAVGADLSNVGKALSLASLPDYVVEAFPSPLELQYRWAKPLHDAVQADAEGVRRRAMTIRQTSPRPPAKAVFDRLTGADARKGPQAAAGIEIVVDGKTAGLVALDAKGVARVTIDPGLVPTDRLTDLAEAVRRFLGEKGRGR